MSRIGKVPIIIPSGVKVDLEGNKIKIKGIKGEISTIFFDKMNVLIEDSTIKINSPKEYANFYGLTRTLIANMVKGVTVGYEKVLQIIGVGYKAVKIGKGIQLNLGFSHPVIIEPPEGINLEVEGNNKIIIRGIDKQLVGQVAANIRAIRLPEVYKGKGIRYEGEIVPKKAGKAGKTAAAK